QRRRRSDGGGMGGEEWKRESRDDFARRRRRAKSQELRPKCKCFLRFALCAQPFALCSMLLVIDNYDSFTYNLVQYLGELGEEIVVRRNSETTVDQIESKVRPD